MKSQSNAVSMRFHKHISKRDYVAYGNLAKSDEGDNDKFLQMRGGVDFA